MKNTLINRRATQQIAIALEELNERVIYVGGAVVSCYVNDPAAEDVRPTGDIDITFQIASRYELETLRESLLQKGFYQSAEDDVVCRFRYEDKKIDVMSTREIDWAPANPWFEAGFEHAITIDIGAVDIRLLPLPYFLATKFAAFNDRGAKDPRTSHDFEDIVYLLNYSSLLAEEVLMGDLEVQVFLKQCFQNILEDDTMQEAVLGQLYHEDQMVQYERIIQKLNEIINAIKQS